VEIADEIRERGPMTVAAFMELALYDSRFGYYARAAQRSGRAGDFFTSVDVGSLFGELLAAQIAEMARLRVDPGPSPSPVPPWFDLVEAGAGNGRLSADILSALAARDPTLYSHTRLHLVEASPAARAAQPAMLGGCADRLVSSSDRLPASFAGVLLANELLDAFPVHQVVMRRGVLQEVYVEAGDGGQLVLHEGEPSTPELAAYFARLGVTLEEGWRAEANLRAVEWVRDAAKRLQRGFMILIDYGHEARDLYSVTHSAGTLTTFARHHASSGGGHAWLQNPGRQDITAHVDWTSVRAAAESEGMTTLGLLDQTYFVMGLLGSLGSIGSLGARGSVGSKGSRGSKGSEDLALNPVLTAQLKVLILGKGVGAPALAGLSYRVRLT
jgi:SAM-dependent MidA family methyltransferase